MENFRIPFDIQEEWNALVTEIRMHNRLYYEENLPLISDDAYDSLYRRLVYLEQRFPGLVTFDSPTQQVQTSLLQDGKARISHLFPLYSLDSVYSPEEIAQFIKRTSKALDGDLVRFVMEGKIDGLTLALQYKKGNLVSAATRGDGQMGENVTQHVRHIAHIPLEIDFKDMPEDLEIRGEVYIEKEDFESFNRDRRHRGELCFSNPRNAAAGALRHLDSVHVMHRGLKFAVHGVWPQLKASYGEAMECLRRLGFCMPLSYGFGTTADGLLECFEKVLSERETLKCEIDGLVYKIDSWSHHDRLGYRAKSPRFAIAHKFPAKSSITELQDIQIQVGRTGILTPVAILSPVLLGGVQVARASLHNEDEILKKDLRIGDRVRVQRAGDVIPQVCEVVYPRRSLDETNTDRRQFMFPRFCPVCQGPVVRLEEEAAHRCISGLKCSAQKIWALHHFVSKDAMDIEGLGLKNVHRLHKEGILNEVVDLFTLSQYKNHWMTLDGWGKKSVNGVLESIEYKRHNVPRGRFFYALSIPHVGKTTANILGKKFSPETLLAMPRDALHEILIQIQGFGYVLAQSITDFFHHNAAQIQNIMRYLTFEKNETVQVFLPFQGKHVVFTGKFHHAPRSRLINDAQHLGATVSTHLSKRTDYLVVGTDPGSKYLKAQALHIQTLTEEEWMELLAAF
ncbi:NAD-dependent DNA ligase LigA [Holospora curviuscula]|uniref:DNA ligase n=1 Tax=Holospora curviuscula TaxID=1082868 RepID=A0A2S5RE79_9PROT|nr:NAD-dependent DNA ligase LigA [Holospora curviuscula]PPE05614.1 DNA ligase [Holospora curviuscula]